MTIECAEDTEIAHTLELDTIVPLLLFVNVSLKYLKIRDSELAVSLESQLKAHTVPSELWREGHRDNI